MAVTIRRREKTQTLTEADPLQEVGLVEAFVPYTGLRPMTWPHFKPGARVRIKAKGWPHLEAWKHGDVGTVEKVCPAGGMYEQHPDDDLYLIRLGNPRVEGKEVVGLVFKDIESAPVEVSCM